MYNTIAGAMVFTEGQNIQLRPYNSGGRDTIVIVGDDSVGYADDADPTGTALAAAFQPLAAVLTDIKDTVISTNLDNTAYPWADNEMADNHTHTDGTIDSLDFNQTQTDQYVRLLITDTAAALRSDLSDTARGAVSDSALFHKVSDTFYTWVPLAGDTALRIYRDSTNDTTTFEAVGVLKLKGTGTDPLALGQITVDSAGIDSLVVNLTLNLPNNSVTDAMVSNTLTASSATTADSALAFHDGGIDSLDFNQTQTDQYVRLLIGPFIDTTTLDTINVAHKAVLADSADAVTDGSIDSLDFNQTQTDVYVNLLIGPFIDTTTLDTIAVSHKAVLSDSALAFHDGGIDSLDFNQTQTDAYVNLLIGPFLDTTTLDTIAVAHKAVLADSAGVVLATDINWDYEWIQCRAVTGYVAALEDSIYLYDHVQLVGGDTLVLVVDSAGDVTADDRDTFNLVFDVPYDCTIDSLAYLYMNTGDSGVVAVDFRGPSLTAGLNLCDSSYWTDGTNRTSATWAVAGQTFAADVVAAAGDRYSLQIESHFCADNNRLRIGWAKIRVRR